MLHVLEQFSNGSARMCSMPVVYKITYQNKKIYVGCDMTDSVGYFGSPNSKLIELDFTPEERRKLTATKEILWESATASVSELRSREREWILKLGSNDPAIGYNRNPIFKPSTSGTQI
jgi:hypothetical protein